MDHSYTKSVGAVEPRMSSGNEENKNKRSRYRKGKCRGQLCLSKWRYSRRKLLRNRLKRKEAEKKLAEKAGKETFALLSDNILEPVEENAESLTSKESSDKVLEVQSPEACSYEGSIKNEPLEIPSSQPSTSRGSTILEHQQLEEPQPSTSEGILQNEDIEIECTFKDHLVKRDDVASEKEEINQKQDLLWKILRNEQEIIDNELLVEDKVPNDANSLASNQDGARCIINDEYYLKQIQELNKHNPMISCNISDMDVIRKQRDGLKTIWTYKCRMCNYEKQVFSEPKKSTGMDLNRSAVAATIATGGGYAQLQENLSACDIKCMSSRQYRKHHDDIGEDIFALSEKSRNEAAEQERQLALARGDVIRCPLTNEIQAYCIPVIADGCWLKRSYRTTYTSLSGTGVIIGYHTGKVLYVGVKNKACAICNAALRKEKALRPHKCFKNWTASSTSMECNAIAEGFQVSLKKHKLVYNVLIADGDSSMYSKILDCNPYWSLSIQVKKLECTNHLLRNFAKKVRNIRTIGILRNQVENRILQMRTGITHAARYRAKEDVPLQEKMKRLHMDITNIPSHVFGEHKRCRELGYFCDGNPKENEKNIVPDLQKKGVYDRLEEIVKYVARKAESFLYNYTNNAVECFNSLMAKYTSGKRLNLGQRGSYTMRVHLAVLQYNSGKKGLSKLSTDMGKEPPKMVVAMETQRINESRKRKEKACTAETKHRPRKKIYSTKDYDYGVHVKEPDLGEDMFKLEVEEIEEETVKSTDDCVSSRTTQNRNVSARNRIKSKLTRARV